MIVCYESNIVLGIVDRKINKYSEEHAGGASVMAQLKMIETVVLFLLGLYQKHGFLLLPPVSPRP